MSRHAQSASQLCFKELSYKDAFLLIIIIVVIIIIVNITIIVLYLTSVIIHINDKTNYKSHFLKLDLFTPT